MNPRNPSDPSASEGRGTVTVLAGHHRRYTKRQKVTAIIAAELSSIPAAAADKGIPESTLRYWLESPKFAELRAKTREDTAEGFAVITSMAMGRLQELIPTMEARDLITLMGVATDKGQLLSGEATSRTESRELLTDFDDHERQAMTDWLRDVAKERLASGS